MHSTVQILFGLSIRLTNAGVEHLLRDVKDSTVSNLSSEVSHMASGLRALKSRLSEVQEYLNLVLEGRLPVNHDIMYHLQACYTSFIPPAVIMHGHCAAPLIPSAHLNTRQKIGRLQSRLGCQHGISQCLHSFFSGSSDLLHTLTLMLRKFSSSALAQSAEMWMLFDSVCNHCCGSRPSCSWHAWQAWTLLGLLATTAAA